MKAARDAFEHTVTSMRGPLLFLLVLLSRHLAGEGPADPADGLDSRHRRHDRRSRLLGHRSLELQGRIDPRQAARAGGAADRATRRRQGRADRQRQQHRHDASDIWLTLAETHQPDHRGGPGGRRRRRHARHQHARGDGVFPEPDGEDTTGRSSLVGLDAAGDRDRAPTVRSTCSTRCATPRSPGRRGKGVLVVLNDEINAARDVTKTNTYRVETFKAPELGILGYVDEDKVASIERRPGDTRAQSEFDVTPLDALPKVEILYSYVEPRHRADRRRSPPAARKGIVFAGTGAGAHVDGREGPRVRGRSSKQAGSRPGRSSSVRAASATAACIGRPRIRRDAA